MTASLAVAANHDLSINVAENVGFGIIAALMVFGAIRVVTTRNVVHAALFLVLVLAGAAAQFILLGAEFVALTQVLVYIGAIVVLFLFGIMLTRAPIRGDSNLTHRHWAAAALVGAVLFGLLTFTLLRSFGADRLPDDTQLTMRPEATAQFEAQTGIATAGQSKKQLVAAVDDLKVSKSAKRHYLATAEAIATPSGPLDSNAGAISDTIFSGYLIPFEVISVLLTAALIGAIVLARKE